MIKSLKSISILVAICAFVSVALAMGNYITTPIIETNDRKNADAALIEVLPEGGSFTLLDTAEHTLPPSVRAIYSASNGGYVIKLTTTGYAPEMVLMCGIHPDSTVADTKLVSSGETPSIGGAAAETFSSSVVGSDIGTIDSIDTISGATKTTAAYRSAVRDALSSVVILGGGSVDLRSEEEILQDNLSSALESAGGRFTEHFFIEEIDGVDKIYTADNGSGYVCVIGESFIAVDAEHHVLTDCSAEEAETAANAVSIISSTTAEIIDLSLYPSLPSQIISAEVTDSDCYVLEVKGAGYGIAGGNEYHPSSGKYIIIRVSITSDGRIIDCLTLSEEESEGIGSVCAEESFYGQFDGKTEATYDDIDGISGATLTTNGYKKAIQRAFEAVRIFEGGRVNE